MSELEDDSQKDPRAYLYNIHRTLIEHRLVRRRRVEADSASSDSTNTVNSDMRTTATQTMHAKLFNRSQPRNARLMPLADATLDARSSGQHERHTAAQCRCGSSHQLRRASPPSARQQKLQRDTVSRSLPMPFAATTVSWIARRAPHSACCSCHSTAQ